MLLLLEWDNAKWTNYNAKWFVLAIDSETSELSYSSAGPKLRQSLLEAEVCGRSCLYQEGSRDLVGLPQTQETKYLIMSSKLHFLKFSKLPQSCHDQQSKDSPVGLQGEFAFKLQRFTKFSNHLMYKGTLDSSCPGIITIFTHIVQCP